MGNFLSPWKMKYIRQITLLLILWPATGMATAAEPLTVSYFERPPYYYTDTVGEPGGFLLERTRNILRQAGVEAKFLALTPYQILYVLRHAMVPHCSIGWFKNAQREQFAKFSEPIYRNRDLMLLTTKAQLPRFSDLKTLRAIFSDRHLTMARMGGFSYGSYVDDLLEKLTPKTLFLAGEQGCLLRAVAAQRASYMLVAPEEIDTLIGLTGLSAGAVVAIPLADVPAGNLRYLMCNRAVTDETLERLNQAIDKLYPLQTAD